MSGSYEEQMIALHDHGVSWTDAYNSVVSSKKAGEAKGQVTAGEKIGADVSGYKAEWQEKRDEMVMPSETAMLPSEYVQKPAAQKGIEIWRETGIEVYPKESLGFNSTTFEDVRHVGVSIDGVIHELSEEEMSDLNKWYWREYEMVLNKHDPENETPEDLKKALDKMERRIKTDYIEDRGDK